MPVPNGQFDDGLDDTMQKVLDFLKDNKTFGAYSSAEIAKGIGVRQHILEHTLFSGWVLQSELHKLVKKNLIEAKRINGQNYYRAK